MLKGVLSGLTEVFVSRLRRPHHSGGGQPARPTEQRHEM